MSNRNPTRQPAERDRCRAVLPAPGVGGTQRCTCKRQPGQELCWTCWQYEDVTGRALRRVKPPTEAA